jgi:hypothetical protein
MPKQGETLTGTSNRPRPEGSIPTKGSDLQKSPGTYKEALTNTKIAILKENHHKDKLTENEQDHNLEAGKGVSWNSKRRCLPPLT